MREDHAASWAWLALVIAIALFVTVFDLWAWRTGHKTMSAQFRDWLFAPATAPFIAAGWVGAFAGLTAHWFIRRGPH